MLQWWRFFSRPTWKLASALFPWQKQFSIGFWIIVENKLCDQDLWILHILFTMIIFTNENNFYEFCSQHLFSRSKKLNLGYKLNMPQLCDFKITNISFFVNSFRLLFKNKKIKIKKIPESLS